ncbi:MAG: M20/M25/M40 family metallo-hydrolase [Demequina sp.]|nr:M20/M25/M40 family metallo-hydrolase [Demequina sp.]
MAAFAAVGELRSRGFAPTRPIAVVNFTEEEGGRFGLACLGSRLMTGAVDRSRALALADRDGVTLEQAMTAAGLEPARVGADPDRVRRIGAFVEPHIEQGHLPVIGSSPEVRGLAAAGAPLGVLTEIWAHGRWRVDIPGTPNHAGTTALEDRDDPVLTMARGILLVREMAHELGVIATVGKVSVVPGAVNAIASLATMWIDARGADAERVPLLAERVAAALGVSAVLESWTAATPFDEGLSDALAGAAQAASGVPAPRLPSGAGHDSGVLAEAGIPAAMLVVRNLDGTSHAAGEHADDADAHLAAVAIVSLLEALR